MKQQMICWKRLSGKEWTGYKTLTAYFVNYRVNNAGQFEYDVVFSGVNTEEGTAVEKNQIIHLKQQTHYL